MAAAGLLPRLFVRFVVSRMTRAFVTMALLTEIIVPGTMMGVMAVSVAMRLCAFICFPVPVPVPLAGAIVATMVVSMSPFASFLLFLRSALSLRLLGR
jgi:hypothetical protein